MAANIIYTLDHHLNLLSVAASDAFKSLHLQMQAKGNLDHAFSQAQAEELKKLRYLKKPNW